MKKYVAEAIGTFGLVFAGTGAIVVNDVSNGTITHVGIAITFGLIVMSMIYAIGDVSGAHINPAVTIGFWAAKRFEGRHVVPYIASQCIGALAASALLRVMFLEHPNLGATLPAETVTVPKKIALPSESGHNAAARNPAPSVSNDPGIKNMQANT